MPYRYILDKLIQQFVFSHISYIIQRKIVNHLIKIYLETRLFSHSIFPIYCPVFKVYDKRY